MVNNHVFLNKKIFLGTPIIKKIKLRISIIHEGGHYKWRRDQEDWIYNRLSPENWNMMEDSSE